MNVIDIICLTISIIGALWCFYGTIQSIKEKNFGLDILAIIAILATIGVGEYIAGVVVVIMTVTGEFLETYAGKKATKELSLLLERAPRIAHLKLGDNRQDIKVEDIKKDDILVVLPGELIPVDAILLEDGEFDESGTTGESLPVSKLKGDTVFSGTILLNSPISIKSIAKAKDSQYQKIVDMVKEAEEQKSSTVRLASTISIPFTIVSLIIASAAWIISGNPMRFAEVLVLATPCPLLIAAPVAFLGGISRASKMGIIVKSGSVLEALSKVKVVAFDKTGTVTVGSPIFHSVEGDKDTLKYAGALEINSAHILAISIVHEVDKQKIILPKVENIEEEIGKGLSGIIDGKNVRVGSFKFVTNNQINPNINMNELSHGEMAVYVSVDNEIIGRIILKDELRPEAISTMNILRKIGIQHLTMLTGDSKDTAEYIGKQLGVKDIRSHMLPQQKLEAVQGLKYACGILGHNHSGDNKSKVLMVGDGINDAPVLTSADIGIAIATKGSTIASQSADAVIMHEDISLVAKAIIIAKDTINISKQSMIGGIALSITLMLIATTGVIPAIGGAALQELVDIIAIANGVRAAFKR